MAMLYPVGEKENTRYRGPVESIKILRANGDIEQNLKLLYNKFNELEELNTNLKTILDDNNIYKSHRNVKVMNNNLSSFAKEAITNG
jgi:hypothetical protein